MTAITTYHGAASIHQTLKAATCELGYPAGVWTSLNRKTASRYAERHIGGGTVATIELDAEQIFDFDQHEMAGRECQVATARRIKREGYAAMQIANDILVFKTRKAGMRIIEWGRPDALPAGKIKANRCSCH